MKKSKKESRARDIISRFREIGLLAFIILFTIYAQISSSRFLSPENINDLLRNVSIYGILAIGMMMVIITRGIDLSIGATVALSGMTVALVDVACPALPIIGALGIGIGVGLICGAIIGFLIAKIKILPIIATLGMMNVFRGLTYIIDGTYNRGNWVSADQMSDNLKSIASAKLLGFSILIWIVIVLFIVAYYFLEHTRMGRKIYAIGSNPDSAVISGIKIDNIIFMVYVIMGALAGLAGVLYISKFAFAQGDSASGYELSVIAICVIGGVSIAGGSGRIIGIVLGTVLFGIIFNALPLLKVSGFWETALQGAIILAAVLLNVFIKRSVDRSNLSRRAI